MKTEHADPIVDFSPAIEALKIQMRRTGHSWQHPRIVRWMRLAGFANRYQMEIDHYEILIRNLEKLTNA